MTDELIKLTGGAYCSQMTKPRDERPPLAISQDTWDREDDVGRGRICDGAAELGFRVVVVSRDGVEFAPPYDPTNWTDRR